MLKRSWRGALAGTIIVVFGLTCFSAPALAAPGSVPVGKTPQSTDTVTVSTQGSAGSLQWARIRWPLAGILASAVILVVARQASLFVAWRTGSLVRPQRSFAPERPLRSDPAVARPVAHDESVPGQAWESGWSTAGSGD